MMFLKACPKCHGDLDLDQDVYGTFVRCLQCGLLKDANSGGEIVPETHPDMYPVYTKWELPSKQGVIRIGALVAPSDEDPDLDEIFRFTERSLRSEGSGEESRSISVPAEGPTPDSRRGLGMTAQQHPSAEGNCSTGASSGRVRVCRTAW